MKIKYKIIIFIKRIKNAFLYLKRNKDFETDYSNEFSTISDSQIIYTNRYTNYIESEIIKIASNIIMEFTIESEEFIYNYISFIKSTNIDFRYMTLLDEHNMTRLYISGNIMNYEELILKYLNSNNSIVSRIFELIKTLPKIGWDKLIHYGLLSENDFVLENNYNFNDNTNDYMKSISPYKDFETQLKRYNPYTTVAQIIELDHIEFVFEKKLNIKRDIIMDIHNIIEILSLSNIIMLYAYDAYMQTKLPKHLSYQISDEAILCVFRLDRCMYHCSYNNTWNWNMKIYMKDDNLNSYFNLFKEKDDIYNLYLNYTKYLDGSNYNTIIKSKNFDYEDEPYDYDTDENDYYSEIDEIITSEEYIEKKENPV